ncbi:MAG TPA: carbohydrate kinase, partial [Phycisphaerae bacterium]|nr:carbohydrate kinase [Phycisphaerae bacterium]
MTGEALLGIDLGTTVLKGAVFDARTGQALAEGSVRLPIRTGGDGAREQDPRAVDRALRRLAAALRGRCGRRW